MLTTCMLIKVHCYFCHNVLGTVPTLANIAHLNCKITYIIDVAYSDEKMKV